MGAVIYRARAELRGSWRASIGLGLVVAIAGGIVMAGVAGARRTTGAYPAFYKGLNGTQGALTSDPGHFFGFANIDFDIVQRMPDVVDSARLAFFVGFLTTPTGKVLTPFGDRNPVVLFGSHDDRFGRVLNVMHARTGHLPDPSRADEVAVSFEAAFRYGIHAGDVLQVALPTFQDLSAGVGTSQTPVPHGPHLAVRVTAIEVSPGELAGGVGYPPVHFTPAFYDRYASTVPAFQALIVKLSSDKALPDFLARVQKNATLGGPNESHRPEFLNLVDNTKSIDRTAHVQATALWLLALLTAISATLIIMQAVVRQTYLESTEYTTLRAFGATRAQLFGITLFRNAFVGLVGAGSAVVIAWLLSPLTPIGVARDAELHPGFRLDGSVLLLGVLAIFALVLVVGLYPALRASRARVTRPESAASTSRIVELLARGGTPPTPVTGVRMALEPGSGRTAVPIRSTLAGSVIGLASITVALMFAASLAHVQSTPRVQGWNWTASIGDDFDPGDAPRVLAVLRSIPQIDAVAAGGAANVQVRGRSISAVGFDPVIGSIDPVMIEGRKPSRDDEIILGERTFRELSAHMGEGITVASGSRTKQMRIVGVAVAPTIANESFNGRGGVVTFAALRELVPSNPEDIFLFRVADPRNVPAALADVRARLADLAVQVRPAPGDLEDLARVSNLPLVLAGLLALLAIATLTHLLVSAIRRRRRDLAVMKTIGFVTRQVRASVAWQATVLAVVTIVIGLPIGIATGRWAWSILAHQLGFLSEPVVSVGGIGILCAATVAAANLIAVLPARAAARTQPALTLRSE